LSVFFWFPKATCLLFCTMQFSEITLTKLCLDAVFGNSFLRFCQHSFPCPDFPIVWCSRRTRLAVRHSFSSFSSPRPNTPPRCPPPPQKQPVTVAVFSLPRRKKTARCGTPLRLPPNLFPGILRWRPPNCALTKAFRRFRPG